MGGAGGRVQNTAPCRSQDRKADQSGPLHARFLVVIIVVGGLAGGGEPAAPVAGRGGSDGRGSSGGDNDMFCCEMRSDVVFLVWWRCELHAVRDFTGVNDVVCGWTALVGMKK